MATTEKKQKAPVKPKLLFKEESQVIHHCWRLNVEKMKKNLSWRKGEVIIDQIEHCHYFHSINSLGMHQTKSNDVGGHFHEVKWEINDEGYPVATCGPALRKVHKKLANGKLKTIIEPIKFWDAEKDKWIEDNHTHECEYKHSNKISMGKAQNYVQPKEPSRVDNDEVSLDVLG